MSRSYKACDAKGKGSLQTDDSAWSFGDWFCFFFFAVRCMVGGNQVDGSICKSLNNRLTVLFGTERRIHFRKCSMLKDCVFRQCKMMRCGFGVKFCTHFLISTNQIDRDTGADMLDHNIGAGFQCQHAVSCNQRFFCNGRRTVDAKRIGYLSVADSVVADERRIFFVKADRYVKLCRFFHCVEAEFCV